MWRAVVVGCGWIGSGVADDPRADGIQSHAAAYAACPDTELAGVCDADAACAQAAATRFGLGRGFHNLSDLLSSTRPQIVSVCTPDATHAAVLREVLNHAGVRAVIAEKPLATDLAEARALVELADSRGVILAVNYSRRFAPSHIEARRRLIAGDLGMVQAVQGCYTKGIMHNGTHWFDLAQWMVGKIARVQAWSGHAGGRQPDPTCHVRMMFADGQTGFLLGLDEERYTIFEMDILGSLGRLRLMDSGVRISWDSVADSPHFSGYRTLQPSGEIASGFKDVALRLVEDVVAALGQGRQAKCSGRDGVAALAAADAARRSLATGIECNVQCGS
ncbi:MAG TPA: Gfo/Idh/MocA family oxidoreductase [Steroidobacteraceae bacterium]|jgi:predicted dehydrogenase